MARAEVTPNGNAYIRALKGRNREAAVLAQHANTFVASPCEKEGAFTGLFSESTNMFACKLGYVVPLRGNGPH